MVLTLLDKVMLSRLLSLGEYGYYNLAAIVAGGLFMLATPIHQTYLPRLNKLHAANNIKILSDSYHKAAQLITVIVGSAALVLCGFSVEILHLWTHNNSATSNSALILSILSIGNLLNCLMIMPYQIQYTFGWTSLMIKLVSVLVICTIPALLWATPLFGAEGAACVWVAINIIYVVLGIHFMHKKILQTEKRKWCIDDVARPLAAAGFIVIICRVRMPLFQSDFHQLIYIFFVSSLAISISALAVKDFRKYIYKYFGRTGFRKQNIILKMKPSLYC
jgi:O-antigen/teichoic acid export membrane protein